MTEDNIGRYFRSVTPSSGDIARAEELQLTECPRRYCWWWMSLSFDWDHTPAEGCQYAEAPKRPHWQFTDVPCCRSDVTSGVDHYEPREPHLEADGFHRYRFCGPQNQLPDDESASE